MIEIDAKSVVIKAKCFIIGANVPALGEVANFGTDYFLLKIKFLAKCKRELTTKFAILPNACCAMYFYLQYISIFCSVVIAILFVFLSNAIFG
jgi:hypothetical protein